MNFVPAWSRVVSAMLLLVSILAIPGAIRISQGATPPYRIVSIDALLFYNHRGEFSENIIDNPRFILWNVIIGEGSAEGPSNETLVIVEVAGRPGSFEEKRKVELQAIERRKVKLKRASEIGIISDGGKYFVPFLLYDTGCQPIRISARILGQAQASKLEKTINFRCGE